MKLFITLIAMTSAFVAQAEEAPVKSPWAHESEASVVQASGNTESESYSAKQKTTYTNGANIYSTTGRLLETKAGSTQTAKSWDLTGRYDRTLTEKWSAFASHGAESDKFAGFVQRDNTNLGGTYYFDKDDIQVTLVEASFQSTKNINNSNPDVKDTESGGVAKLSWSRKLSPTVTANVKGQYFANFTESKQFRYEYEPSISVMMSQVLALKVSHLTKFQNEPGPGLKKEDRTLTTSIVAKF